MVFIGGHYIRLAVKSASGRAGDQLSYTVVNASLEQVQAADDVDLRVERGVGDGLRHLRLGRVMIDELRPKSCERLIHLRLVAQVDAVDGSRPVDVVNAASAEVVQDGDLMAGCH